MYKTTILADHQRGLRRRGGRIVRWLRAGRHTLWFAGSATYDEILDLSEGYVAYSPELDRVAPAGTFELLDVPVRQYAVVRRNGVAVRIVGPGRYLLWQERDPMTATLHSATSLFTDVPADEWSVPGGPERITPVVVHPYDRVVAFVDGVRADVLPTGKHGLNREGKALETLRIDLREQELPIVGQEVMTKDKVSIRVSLTVRFRITKPEQVLETVVNVRDALYTAAQLVARRRIASMTLDALLEGRNEAGADVTDEVKAQAAIWGVELMSIDIKDLVLPGAMKDILNQVLEAEKRAAANVILRREETSATRSLANTAKLMDQNPTLLRLKELESMEKLAETVGSVTVVAGAEQLLGKLLKTAS
ncbi:MAG: slipin family protein [Myxococcota bacterium]